eukprot:7417218-Karenia_brevis.AAC.1
MSDSMSTSSHPLGTGAFFSSGRFAGFGALLFGKRCAGAGGGTFNLIGAGGGGINLTLFFGVGDISIGRGRLLLLTRRSLRNV